MKTIDWVNQSTTKGEDHIEYKFIECIRDNYLYQHVLEPNRYRFNNKPSILDLVLSNQDDNISEITYLPGLGKSDHLILVFELMCGQLFTERLSDRLNYSKANWQSINELIMDTSWVIDLDTDV